MIALDWIILVGTITAIVAYGWWKSRGIEDMEGYLRTGKLRWTTVGLSIMATQASAITFLSTPGQAFEDGMRFVQFYFGLPLAMIFISAIMLPIYHSQKVLTAYEYLEKRFDVRVRLLGAVLFLIQRGLAAGITIYAPAIVLSSILGWSLQVMILVIGVVVIIYTVIGGTRAVSQTQKQQMVVIMGGMIAAAVVGLLSLPEELSVVDATAVAGALGKMNVIDLELDPNNRYNLWSGLTGGFFLALAYFGTDQSQVQRYLSNDSLTASRMGLLFNGLLKVPMQFIILSIGVLVFVFYIFVQPPVTFQHTALQRAYDTPAATQLVDLERQHAEAFTARRDAAYAFVEARQGDDAGVEAARAALKDSHQRLSAVRDETRAVLSKALPDTEVKDTDHVFLTFVLSTLPHGLIGLLIAVILSAAMSSTASELNALGATTVVDIYKRLFKPDADDKHDLWASRGFTAMWGLGALGFASFASLLDNLIEAVNILGSLFYGTILGIFLVAFFLKRVGATAVFFAALLAEAVVLGVFFGTELGFLWYNVVGCAVVFAVAPLLQQVLPRD